MSTRGRWSRMSERLRCGRPRRAKSEVWGGTKAQPSRPAMRWRNLVRTRDTPGRRCAHCIWSANRRISRMSSGLRTCRRLYPRLWRGRRPRPPMRSARAPRGRKQSLNGQASASCPGMRPFLTKTALGILLIGGPALFAQSAGQDMKQAGRDVKSAGQATGDAAKDTGSAVGKTAKKTGRKVKHTSKKVVNKDAGATENGAAKVKDKTDK